MYTSTSFRHVRPRRAALSLLAVLATIFCVRAHAQEPLDTNTWKSRCLSLSAQSDAIDKGSAPSELLQTTHGVAGAKFAAVGQERGSAGQHYIACTMYYTAAMAEHMGNGGKVEIGRAHTDIVLAGAEAKRAAGLPLSFKEKMDRTSGKLNPVGKGGLTPADLAAVYAAFDGSSISPANTWSPSPANGPNPAPPATPTGKHRDTPTAAPTQGSSPWSSL